jgi:hypothetical protein
MEKSGKSMDRINRMKGLINRIRDQAGAVWPGLT